MCAPCWRSAPPASDRPSRQSATTRSRWYGTCGRDAGLPLRAITAACGGRCRVRSVRGSGHAREVSRGVRCVACSVHLKHGLRRERSFGEHVEIVARLQSRATPRHRIAVRRHRPQSAAAAVHEPRAAELNRRGPPRALHYFAAAFRAAVSDRPERLPGGHASARKEWRTRSAPPDATAANWEGRTRARARARALAFVWYGRSVFPSCLASTLTCGPRSLRVANAFAPRCNVRAEPPVDRAAPSTRVCPAARSARSRGGMAQRERW
jgi:hypothetical protein